MAELGGFTRRNAPADTGFDPIEAGTYTVEIENTEQVALSSGNGQRLAMTYNILAPKCSGRKIFDSLNLWHETSDKSRNIAWSQLSKIMEACGYSEDQQISRTEELHGKVISVEVVQEESEYNGEKRIQNRIKAWHPASGNAQVATSSSVQSDAGQAQTSGKPAWAK